MSQNYSKSRQEAEIAFMNIQVQATAPKSAIDEIDLLDKQRQQKTERLRQARLERDEATSAFDKSGASNHLK
ncbi:hypothetical protein MUU53_22580 [Rhizobium lemnae]|uniref:Uncharacterized protein n=1 Tax=Rhizobium lemnae TaxID=1214924 RepID=A0ABV8E3W0_9HYPH|nr:hypothetical protein [Rhizobium lemnae]MCJ8510644.1 hypothetical protein [Rhizobium lemnae]